MFKSISSYIICSSDYLEDICGVELLFRPFYGILKIVDP